MYDPSGDFTVQKFPSSVMLTGHTEEQTANFVQYNYLHKYKITKG